LGIDWERLYFLKEELRASPGRDHAEVELGGEEFALHRGGHKPYTFVLSNRAFQLHLGERIEPRCHAQFRSELLWLSGLEAALERYDAMWQRVGCSQTRPHVVSGPSSRGTVRGDLLDLLTINFPPVQQMDCQFFYY
jgi:hypothetical protein